MHTAVTGFSNKGSKCLGGGWVDKQTTCFYPGWYQVSWFLLELHSIAPWLAVCICRFYFGVSRKYTKCWSNSAGQGTSLENMDRWSSRWKSIFKLIQGVKRCVIYWRIPSLWSAFVATVASLVGFLFKVRQWNSKDRYLAMLVQWYFKGRWGDFVILGMSIAFELFSVDGICYLTYVLLVKQKIEPRILPWRAFSVLSQE